MTLTLNRPWSNISTAHRLIICAKLFVNPTRGSKDIERTRKRDGQTDGRTDGQTDNGAKNNMSPHVMGEDIIICRPWSTKAPFMVPLSLKSPEHGLGINMGKNLNYP